MNIAKLSSELKASLDLSTLTPGTSQLRVIKATQNLEYLRDHPPLELLWISEPNQDTLEFLTKIPCPKFLFVYGSRAEDFSPLEAFAQTEWLRVEWAPRFTGLWDLTKNAKLTGLELIDLTKLRTLQRLESARSLTSLKLEGGMERALKLNGLKPIAKLRKLTTLTILNVQISDESLAPLLELPALTELTLSNQFPTEEYARLKAQMAKVHCAQFVPHQRAHLEGRDTMITGKRKPFLDSSKDQDRIRQFEKQFDDLVQSFKRRATAPNSRYVMRNRSARISAAI